MAQPSIPPTNESPRAKLTALGFCGVDDSVNPRLLVLIGRSYPLIEFGVLFRPGKTGLPRYASKEWLSRLRKILKNDNEREGIKVKLAAHLCGSHVNDLLCSSNSPKAAASIDAFLEDISEWGFSRVQVNATAINGVTTSDLGDASAAQSFLRTANAHPHLEFIIQKNDETLPLWSGVLEQNGTPTNLTFLHDESKGTGRETPEGWPIEPRFVSVSKKCVGFAGGIKPSNVRSALLNASIACTASGGKEFWIDMESGVRTTLLHSCEPEGATEEDIFDLSKCYECIEAACELGLMNHPQELQ